MRPHRSSFFAASLLVVLGASFAAETPAPAPEASERPPRRAWLGVFLGDALDGGVQLVEVVPEGPAERAGLESGDIVLRLNDRAVPNREAADAALQTLHPGEEIRVRVVRDGAVEDRIIVVGNRDSAWVLPRAIEAPEPFESPGGPGQQVLGLRWVEIPEDLRAAWGAPRDAGVVVARLSANGSAAKAGVKVGDVVVKVNGVGMASVNDVPYLAAGTPAKLEIVRRGSSEPVVLKVTPVSVGAPAPAVAPTPPPTAVRAADGERRKLEQEVERLRGEVRRLTEELERARRAQ